MRERRKREAEKYASKNALMLIVERTWFSNYFKWITYKISTIGQSTQGNNSLDLKIFAPHPHKIKKYEPCERKRPAAKNGFKRELTGGEKKLLDF